MSVIIRLQNLPWSANALDIRQFFKGLSIPEGGVHIVGGEMGDAFIAFSTDEDARQAMMRDHEKLNEIPIRLLLSSRTEMQKVIDTARQHSILAIQNKAGTSLPTPTATAATATAAIPPIATHIPPPVVNPIIPTAANAIPRAAVPGVLATAPSFLAYQQQAGITLYDNKSKDENKLTAIRNNADMLKRDEKYTNLRDRRRSRSPDRDLRRRRNSRSRSRSRERDWKDRRNNRRSRSREHSSERSHSHENSPTRYRNRNFNKDKDMPRNVAALKSNNPATGISPWSINAFQNNYSLTAAGGVANAVNPHVNPLNAPINNSYNNSTIQNDVAGRIAALNQLQVPRITDKNLDGVKLNTPITAAPPIIPSFQSYASTATTLNSNDPNKILAATQNSYGNAIVAQVAKPSPNDMNNSPNINATASAVTPMFPGLYLESKKDTTQTITPTITTTITANSVVPQEPIAFANVNPYAQMFPSLFEQAKNLGTTPKINVKPTTTTTTATTNIITNQNAMMSPRFNDNNYNESCSIRVTNMCGSTTYSDLRKFFAGLFIPHNGIKLINDKHGQRIGTAFIQFSRSSSVQKALTRNHSYLKNKQIKVETVSDDEFEKTEDSFRPMNRFDRNDRLNNKPNWDMDDNSNSSRSNPFDDDHSNVSSYIVLFLEEVPGNTTEQDIMKIFSSYTIVDILLTPSPENRRECVAYVKFSRDSEAKSAFEDKSKHAIGYRKIRVRPVYHQEMDRAKEKLRLANEQLMKEEQAQADEELKNTALNKKQDNPVNAIIDDDNDDTEMVDLVNDDSNDHDSCVSVPINNEHKPQNSIAAAANKDPRTANIPSIFELPSQKPPDSFKDDADDAPTDPRLRRKRPSRFDSAPSSGNQNSTATAINTNLNSNLNNINSMNLNANINDVTQIVQNLSANLNSLNTMNAMNFMNNMNLNNLNGLNMNNMNNSINLNALNMNRNNNNNNNNNNNMNMNSMEHSFIIMKNCDYNTRIGDIGELFMSNNLRLKHVEPLRSDRNMPTGEFIVEFVDPRDAERAQSEFNNTMFRSRNLRIRMITPQEIADRLNKPFMNYLPGGNGARLSHNNNNMNMNNDFDNRNDMRNMRNNMPLRGRGGNSNNRRGDNNDMGNFRGRGGRGFNNRDDDDDDDDDDGTNSRDSEDFRRNSRDRERGRERNRDRERGDRERERGERGRERNRDRERGDRERERSERGRERNRDNNNGNSNQNGNANTNTNATNTTTGTITTTTTTTIALNDDGIPEKFTKPNCVLAMENVPYKAELKDIMEFFSDFDLSPDDIIRRFNDDGTATGDARVAFKTPVIARAAFDSKKRKHIFNRSIYLNIL